MKSFSDPFIQRPVLAIVCSAIFVVLGMFALTRLPVSELPSFNVPFVSIVTTYPGTSPEQVEQQLTVPIEQAVSSVPGIDTIVSSSAAGVSTIQINFTATADPAQVANEVRAKVTGMLSQLPKDAQLPTVNQLSSDSSPVIYLSLMSDSLSLPELTDVAERLVRPRLVTVPGVAAAQILGQRRYAIRVALDSVKLAARATSVTDIVAALQGQNVNLPSGSVDRAGQSVPVIANTTLNLPEEFNNLVLKSGPDWTLRLNDVGRASVGSETPTSGVLVNGKTGLAISILRQSDANALDVAKGVLAALPGIQADLPVTAKLDVAFDSSLYIKASVNRVFSTIVEAVLLVTLVVLIFLASLRAALISLVTIPISLIGTLGFMQAMGYSINTFTLLAMVLAVGLVVDDAIIDVENVKRHIREGRTPLDASFIGSREIGFAIVATTATLASVFLPIGLMPGLLGSLFSQFAFTLSAAVIISGITSRTLSPMMCAYILKPDEGRFSRFIEARFNSLSAGFARSLDFLLRHRWLFVPITVLVAGIAYQAAIKLTLEIVPVEDPGYVFVMFQGEPGASYDNMFSEAGKLNKIFEGVEERQSSLIIVGSSSLNSGLAFLVLKPWEERQRSASQIGAAITADINAIPGLSSSIIDPNPLAGGGQAPVQFVIRTTGDYKDLAGVMDSFMAKAKSEMDLRNAQSNLVLSIPRVNVQIDRGLASTLKVTESSIGNTLATLMGSLAVNEFAWQGNSYNVFLGMDAGKADSIGAVSEVAIRSADGKLLPLISFIKVTNTAGPETLSRFNQLPAAQLTATLPPGASLGPALDKLEALARDTLPKGYSYDFTGPSRQMKQANADVGLVFLLALVFIFMFLSAQFESFRDPATILIVVPFAITGALVGLAMVQGGVNIYSAIGMIALVGLVAKNGIIIVEFANQQRDEGVDLRKAVVTGASLRLRPILMTSAATVLGAVPLLLDTGPGSVGRNHIGAVIVGGMLFGTVISLYVVPLIYMMITRRKRWVLPKAPAEEAA
jgi:multidrug efflux pump